MSTNNDEVRDNVNSHSDLIDFGPSQIPQNDYGGTGAIPLTYDDESNSDGDDVPGVYLRDGKFNDEAIHWSTSYIVDELYLQMCESKEIRIRKELLTGEIYCENQNKYLAEAATYAGRISAGDFSHAKYKPVFRLYLEDFSPRLKAELAELPKETVHRIVTEAVFRIFRARHRMIFHEHIESECLRWLFV
jgi:hypothetical protein